MLRTLERAKEACQYISDYAHENGTHSKYKLREAVYHDVREWFDLAAQMTIRALGKVTDAYTTNPDAHTPFDIRGGFPYDSRIVDGGRQKWIAEDRPLGKRTGSAGTSTE